jgi:ATP-dependent exoDNAse (exonuclease V) beta subunit
MMSCKPRVTKNGAPYKSLSFADILRYGLCKSEWTAPSENIISRTLFSLGDIDWESSKPFLQLKTEEKAQIVIPLPEKVAPIRQSLTRLLPSEAEEGGFVDAGTLLTIDDDEGAQQGIAIHAMINTISWLGESEMNDSALIDVALKHAKGSGAERALWAQDRLNELKAMLARPAIARELTKPGGDIEIWREKRFSVVSSKNNLIEGAFDRVVIERKADKISGVVIFDFKTDSLTNSSISEKTRVYRPQIMLYKEALQAMLGLEPSVIRAKLLFLRSGDAVEI